MYVLDTNFLQGRAERSAGKAGTATSRGEPNINERCDVRSYELTNERLDGETFIPDAVYPSCHNPRILP